MDRWLQARENEASLPIVANAEVIWNHQSCRTRSCVPGEQAGGDFSAIISFI